MIVEHGLVLPVLNAHLLGVTGVVADMHRRVPDVNLLRDLPWLLLCLVEGVVDGLFHRLRELGREVRVLVQHVPALGVRSVVEAVVGGH